MTGVRVHTFAAMGTTVTFRAPSAAVGRIGSGATEDLFARAAAWFRLVERTCNRFDTASELSRLSECVCVPTAVSGLLFRAVEFALALAESTEGAFDPTLGKRLESLGFDRCYASGNQIRTPIRADDEASYRDVRLDPRAGTICFDRPLLLDLGAIAKGLAIDLAARELAPLESFVIDAGGDLWLEGCDEEDAPWTVAIRDPLGGRLPAETFEVTGAAVCTSGDYERRGIGGRPHIVDPRSMNATLFVTSVTVIAPSAMVADGLSTAAAVLGPDRGIELLESEGVDGVMYGADLRRFATRGMAGFQAHSPAAEPGGSRVSVASR